MTPYPPIIGLSGVARAGKDTVAGVLRDLYGYRILSFSDALNDALYTLDRSVGVDAGLFVTIPWEQDVPGLNPVVSGHRPGDPLHIRYADLVDQVGYEQAKGCSGVRRLLQAMGTEVGRDMLGEDIWVQALFNQVDSRPVVITNVRFPNEYMETRRRGGVVWRVSRPGHTAALGHVSDTALDKFTFDRYIDNDGTVRELADKVMHILDEVSFLRAGAEQ